MPYLIDGHNLIPNTGLRLDSPDDELELIELLQEFSRNTRSRVEVYFDGAPAGASGSRQIGLVKAHFVSHRSNADSAIKKRIKDLGRNARNWTVVTSDREVQTAAISANVRTESSAQFADRMKRASKLDPHSAHSPRTPGESKMSEPELQDWLDFFGNKQ